SLLVESEHHPGYLTLRAQQNQSSRPTLLLTWIPNTTLKKNPHSIEGSPNLSRSNTPKVSPRRIPRQEFAKSDESVTLTPSPSPSTQDSSFSCNLQRKKFSQDTTSICSQLSEESRDESASAGSSSFLGDEQSKENSSNFSSSCKSQADSGLGGEDISSSFNQVQNNEKAVQHNVKPTRVGVHVNNLNGVDKGPRTDHKNLGCTGISSDDLTYEEQLVAMLNRNKLHAKVKDKDAGEMREIKY
ncbi:TBC1 domain family member 16, partial [Elysia marginata]